MEHVLVFALLANQKWYSWKATDMVCSPTSGPEREILQQ